MTTLAMVRTHARITGRSKALWLAVVPLTAFATLIAIISPAAPPPGGVDELVFAGQTIAILTGIAYAAAFADFAVAPARLGMDELEAATPTRPLLLRVARIAGAFCVVIVPTLAVLLALALVQLAAGRPLALLQAVAVIATIDAPAALVAIALSALSGTLLPRGLGRIAAVLVWFWLVFSTPLIPVPTLNGTPLSVIGDPVAVGLFGAAAIYQPRGLLAGSATWAAIASLAWQCALIVALLAASTCLTRTRRR